MNQFSLTKKRKRTCYFCEEEKDNGAFLSPDTDKRVHKAAGSVWACDDCMSAPSRNFDDPNHKGSTNDA